jgi:hypothetical protein
MKRPDDVIKPADGNDFLARSLLSFDGGEFLV